MIHTDVQLFGYASKIGHIDIYPNDGMNQPDCGHIPILKDICNHSYSHELFLKKGISAYRATSWEEFTENIYDHKIQIGLDLKWNLLTKMQLENKKSYYLQSPEI